MNQRFGHLENLKCLGVDVSSSDEVNLIGQASKDSVVCLNVLEHIEDDERALRNFFDLLKPGGNMVILVPQHQYLYGPVDKAVGHFRRYSSKELLSKIERAGFEIAHAQDFNRMGTFGWWVNGKLLKRDTLSPVSMALFNLLVPVAKVVEKISFIPALSIIVVGRKPATVSKASMQKDRRFEASSKS
jgi:SAM-dependent methyltransferase